MFNFFKKKTIEYFKNEGLIAGVKYNLEKLVLAKEFIKLTENKVYTEDDLIKLDQLIKENGLGIKDFYFRNLRNNSKNEMSWKGSGTGNIALELLPSKMPMYENKSDAAFFNWISEKGIFPGNGSFGGYGFGWEDMMKEAEKIDFIYTQRIKFASFIITAIYDRLNDKIICCTKLDEIEIWEYNKVIYKI